MNGSHIASLAPIIKTIYNPDGTVRSFLTDYGNGWYGLYCKKIGAWGMNISAAQIEEFLALMQSPIVQPNREELQEY